MKNLVAWILIGLLSSLSPLEAQWGGVLSASRSSGTPTPSVIFDGFNVTGEASFGINRASSTAYQGQSTWSDASNWTFTSFKIKLDGGLNSGSGDITGYQYFVALYPMSGGNIVFGSPLATTQAVSGVNSWVKTVPVEFTLASPYSYVAGTSIAIVVYSSHAYDNSNYAVGWRTSASVLTGFWDIFDGSGVSQFGTGFGDYELQILGY